MSMKIIHADLANLRYCNRGSRQFFDRHGLNWASFLRQGVDMGVIEQIDDEMARAVVREAKRRLGVE